VSVDTNLADVLHQLEALEQERQSLLPLLTTGFSFVERDNARKRLQAITQEKIKIESFNT
jgi:hypothetical protein